MPRLLLIRHAKTLQARPGQADFTRELAAKGERQCVSMRAWLNDQLPAGNWQLLCSPAVRTRQTWQQCRPQALHCDEAFEESIYGGSRGDLMALLAEHLSVHDRVILVGHNPVISELVSMLAGANSEARLGFGTGDMALLHSDAGDLHQPWQMDWLYRP